MHLGEESGRSREGRGDEDGRGRIGDKQWLLTAAAAAARQLACMADDDDELIYRKRQWPSRTCAAYKPMVSLHGSLAIAKGSSLFSHYCINPRNCKSISSQLLDKLWSKTIAHTLFMFYKRQPIRDDRQIVHVEKSKRQGSSHAWLMMMMS